MIKLRKRGLVLKTGRKRRFANRKPQVSQHVLRVLTSAIGLEATPALSPNGEWLAYGFAGSSEVYAPERIWVRDLSTPNAQRSRRDRL